MHKYFLKITSFLGWIFNHLEIKLSSIALQGVNVALFFSAGVAFKIKPISHSPGGCSVSPDRCYLERILWGQTLNSSVRQNVSSLSNPRTNSSSDRVKRCRSDVRSNFCFHDLRSDLFRREFSKGRRCSISFIASDSYGKSFWLYAIFIIPTYL